MKNKKRHAWIRYIIFATIALVALSSCGEINRLTRFKLTPRAYSMNYCYSDVRARKSVFDKETWIVFSDRENNDTWQNPGGKVKLKSMSFMEAFFVVGQKGDYLKLVKYDPELIDGNSRARIIRNRDKAQYYGWVHRSYMLLTRQSSLDMATGFRNKAVAIVADTTAVVEPHLFFESDSILAWKNENMTVANGKIPLHELLYILKSSPDGKKLLVSTKTTLSPEDASTETLGWVSSSLVKETGQRLFADISGSVPVFSDKNRNTLEIGRTESSMIHYFNSKGSSALRHSPVLSYHNDSSGVSFNTALAAPVIDRSLNYVLNLNGNRVMFEDFLRLEKDLRKLNLVFVFEGKERVLRDFTQTMSVIQNMQPLFGDENDGYSYKFGAVISYRNREGVGVPVSIRSLGLTDSYSEVMDFLLAETDSVPNYKPIGNNQTWEGLRRAADMSESFGNETNIFVVIGESGYSEHADSVLVRRIAEMNGRILGYQIYNESQSDFDNNFVLQIENMIDVYSRHDAVLRRERLVYTGQFKSNSSYRESSRNVYALDYPEKSMTQGWVLFPGKSENMQLDILAKSIDTLFTEVRHDNETVIDCLYRAFTEFGSKRYRYDRLWSDYNVKDSLWRLNQELPRLMSGNFPSWFMPGSVNSAAAPDYYLLLSENEMTEVRNFLDDITRYEPDFKYRAQKNRKRVCNCPEDNLYPDTTHLGEPLYDEDGVPLYLNTRAIRKHIYKTFMTRLKSSYRLCCQKNTGELKQYSLAEAEFEITGNPVQENIMHRFKIRDLKSKKRMKDFELDEFVLYCKNKKETMETYLHKNKKGRFTSNGEDFYWIPQDLLP